jgi:hypothetical protein
LFRIFKSSLMQGLNIYGEGEGFLFEFTSLSRVWKFEKSFDGLGPQVSGPFPFDRPGRSPSPVRRPCSRWPRSLHGERSTPVAAGGCRSAWLGPPYHYSGSHRGSHHPLRFVPSPIRSRSSLLCFTLATASLPLPIADELPRAVRLDQKECLVTAALRHQEPACSAF